MYKDLLWKAALVVFLIAVAGIYVYPPSEKLKQGLDLAGGTSLIYEIDASDLSPADRRGLAGKMIPILLKRIDPTHVANIVMRPQGDTRIEIQLPVSSRDTITKRKAYEEALMKLESENVNLLQIKRSLTLPAETRQAELARFSKDSPERKQIIDELTSVYDLRSKKQAERDDLAAKLDAMKKQMTEMGLPESGLDYQVQTWAKAAADARKTQIQDYLKNVLPAGAPSKAEEFLPIIDQYLDLHQEWAGIVNELTAEETGLNTRWNAAVAKLGDINLSIDTFRQVLEMPAKSDQRSNMLKTLQEKFASRAATIREVVSTYDLYAKVGGRLDDPEDLKRMLKGSGVLEFRILPTPGDSGVDAAAQREALKAKGPKGASTAQYIWCEIEDPATWQGGIVEQFGDKLYVLASNLDNEKMVRTDRAWKLKRAYPTVDEQNKRAIGFTFDEVASKLFYQLTSSNLQRPLCILLDNVAISAPNINSAISTSGVITGKYNQTDIEDMVNKLNAGSFPARLSELPISEKTIGPAVGADNKDRGLLSGKVALVATAVFMILYYLLGGAIADIALVLNVLFVLGTMSMLRATFTMGGIAGMVLTIGMSVDANVLIFERIREELRRGSSLRAAIANGYSRAFTTIFDSNLTTFLTALILYLVASEEIKGFALVLMIGIAWSMFTALFVTRLIFDFLTGQGLLTKDLKMLGLFQKINVNWMKMRPMFFVISGSLIVLGMIAFFTRNEAVNSKYDIEFTGGTSVQIDLKEGTGFDRSKVEEIFRNHVGESSLKAARINSVGDTGRQFEITTTETNRTTAIVTMNQAGQSVEALTKAIREAEDTQQFVLSKLSITPKDATTFEIVTTRVNASMVKQVLTDALGQNGTVTDLHVDELVTNAVREAFADYLAVQENLAPEIVSAEKIGETDGELNDFLGGIKIVCKLSSETTAADVTARINEIRFKPDMQDIKWFNYRLLSTDLAALAPEDKLSSFVYVSVHPEAGFREFSDNEWTSYVDNEKSKLIAAGSLESTLSRVTQIDASVGSEAKTRALIAMLLSFAGIIAYLWVRFGTARYGLAAVVALVHDVLITLGVVVSCTYISETVFGRALLIEDFKINLELIAAFLTLVGYSVNDTIVVFDRIRENRGKNVLPTAQIINDSINQTLSRTILTSFATFIAVFVMYVWGGSGFRGFNFVMLFGILIGTYSSVAIAAPILISGGSKKAD